MLSINIFPGKFLNEVCPSIFCKNFTMQYDTCWLYIIQAPNILLDEHGHVKISDFGLAWNYLVKKTSLKVYVIIISAFPLV